MISQNSSPWLNYVILVLLVSDLFWWCNNDVRVPLLQHPIPHPSPPLSFPLLYFLYLLPGTLSSFRRVYEEPIVRGREPDAPRDDKELGERRANEVNN